MLGCLLGAAARLLSTARSGPRALFCGPVERSSGPWSFREEPLRTAHPSRASSRFSAPPPSRGIGGAALMPQRPPAVKRKIRAPPGTYGVRTALPAARDGDPTVHAVALRLALSNISRT